MRQISFSSSFDRAAEDIGVDIEARLGEEVRRQFVRDLSEACTKIAIFPAIGKDNHGYKTTSLGFVFKKNWIFFEYDDSMVRFIHIVPSRRGKLQIPFR